MIKYDLKAFECAYAFQITSQDPIIAAYLNRIGGTYYASNGWKIRISKVPEIDVFSKTIYLRGSDASKDLRVDRTWNLPSNSFRDAVIGEVATAITEIISSARDYSHFVSVSFFEYGATGVSYFTPEVKAPAKFKIDSEGWGNNKLDPSKKTFLN